MQVQDVAKTVIDTLARQFIMTDSEVKLSDQLFRDLGMDSLDRVELLMMMEDALHIDIPDDEAEKLTTVQEVIDYMTAKVQSCKTL